jgi:hypothetical protein
LREKQNGRDGKDISTGDGFETNCGKKEQLTMSVMAKGSHNIDNLAVEFKEKSLGQHLLVPKRRRFEINRKSSTTSSLEVRRQWCS